MDRISVLSCLHIYHEECFRQMLDAGLSRCAVYNRPVVDEIKVPIVDESRYYVFV